MGRLGRLGRSLCVRSDRSQRVPAAAARHFRSLETLYPARACTTRSSRWQSGVPGVIHIEKCFVRKMGFDYYVDLHVVVDGNLPVRHGHRIAHEVKDAIRLAYPRVADVLVHVEPDTYESYCHGREASVLMPLIG